jgi:hypothetical protein
MWYLFGVIEKELVQDKKPSLQDAVIPKSLYQLSTAELVYEMKPRFRAESLLTHFQGL